MAKKYLLLLAAVLAMPMLVYDVALAQNGPTQGVSPAAPPTTSADNQRHERVQKRKMNTSRRFGVVEQNSIRGRCQAIRGLVTATEAQIGRFEAQRNPVYRNVASRLETLSGKLKAADIDTAAYEQHVAALKTKIDAYSSELAALQQTVADLVAIDCAADPEGFAITLLEARAQRAGVIAKGRDIRSHLKDAVKPAFMQLKDQVQARSVEGGRS